MNELFIDLTSASTPTEVKLLAILFIGMGIGAVISVLLDGHEEKV